MNKNFQYTSKVKRTIDYLLGKHQKYDRSNIVNELLMYQLPIGGLFDAHTTIVKNGAMTSATFAKDGNYDKITVTGGDNTSYVTLPRHVSLNNYYYKIVIKIVSVEATPIFGMRHVQPSTTYAGNLSKITTDINLSTGTITTFMSGELLGSSATNWTAASVGDIIELIVERRHLVDSRFTFKKLTGYGSELSTQYYYHPDGDYADSNVNAHQLGITLAGGAYTILEASLYNLDPYKPKFIVMGDSMSCAIRLMYPNSIAGKLSSIQPYGVTSIGSGSLKLKGVISTLWQTLALEPEYAILVTYIDPLTGAANPANGNYATWNTDFQKLVTLLKANNITPIFVHPEKWNLIDSSGTNSAYYKTFLDTTYPSELKVYVPASQISYSADGLHYSPATNEYIARQIDQLVGKTAYII